MEKTLTESQVFLQLYPGYSEADTQIFQEFHNLDAKPERGFIVDFLGSRIRTTSVWKEARILDGRVMPIPVPGDFHAEAIEWIGLLKAVHASCNTFVAMELGAGFGPWIVAGGVAARSKGISDIRLYAVEGDSGHYQLLVQHLSDNGFLPTAHHLFEAAVGIREGVALWPVYEVPSSEQWGLRPTLNGKDYMGREFERTRQVKVLSMLELLKEEHVWDLVHIDVQGDEVALCRSSIAELNARVKWMIAATHSRKLDGDLLELMSAHGWLLEHEKPSRFTFLPGAASLEAMTTLDGTQVWRNPQVLAPSVFLTSFSQMISCDQHLHKFQVDTPLDLRVAIKNTGTQTWDQDRAAPVMLGYRWIKPDGSLISGEGRAALSSRLHPEESCSLNLVVTPPADPGIYKLLISMVQEGVAWFYLRGADPLILPAVVE